MHLLGSSRGRVHWDSCFVAIVEWGVLSLYDLFLEAGENILCLHSINKGGCLYTGPSETYWAFPVYFTHGSGLVVFIEDPSHPLDSKLEDKLLNIGLPAAIFVVLLLFQFRQEILVFLDLRSQGFGPSGHSFDNPFRHGAKTDMFECPVGGKGSSFSIFVVNCINVGGCKERMFVSNSSLLRAALGLAFFGSPPGFGLS